jgi:ketosteroid isomerase-like protein
MSHENRELALQLMRTLNERDAEGLIALADPEVQWHSFFAIGNDGMYRGHDGTRQYVSDLADAWDIVRADVDDALSVGDVTVLVGRLHYRGRGSGAESETPAGWMLKFRDGKVIRFRAFQEPEEALEAVGSR